MTGESDAVGQLIDATLVGSAFERGGAAKSAHGGNCANCGAALSGAYCQKCGQRGHVHRSLLHLLEEFFHGILHLDGKIWRTAPLLLLRPGVLTRRYVEGQRVRFPSPIAMFLFSVFLMFFAVSTIDTKDIAPVPETMSPEARAQLQQELSKAEEGLDRKTLAPERREAVREAIERAKKAADSPEGAGDDLFVTPLGLDWRAISKKLAKSGHFGVRGEEEARVRASLEDPDLLVFKLRSAASEFSFMLVPISVPFIWLMFFRKRGVYMFDHVIFSLHSLSFMALFVTVLVAALKLHWSWLFGSWLFLVPPLHMFLHLKGAYGLGVAGALWRTFALSVIALAVLFCYMAAILVLGLVH
jgi:hypothetical protein